MTHIPSTGADAEREKALIELHDPVLDASHGPTRMLLVAEYWKREALKARALATPGAADVAADRVRSPYVLGVKPSNWDEQIAAGAPAETVKPCPRGCTSPEVGGSGCMAVTGDCADLATPAPSAEAGRVTALGQRLATPEQTAEINAAVAAGRIVFDPDWNTPPGQPATLAQQVEHAQAEVVTWSESVRESVGLPPGQPEGCELPALPEPLEIDWPQLNPQALGCGVEDRNIHDRYEAAGYGWQDGVDRAIERVPAEIFDADQMLTFRAEGIAAALAARQAPGGARDDLPALPEAKESGAVYGIIDPDYGRIYTMVRKLAWEEGYAIGLHGSFTRDLDLIAVPWESGRNCKPTKLIARIKQATGLTEAHGNPGVKPYGRLVWTLLLPEFGDPRFVDLSIMPAIAQEPAQ